MSKTHTVVRGDTLWRISSKYYGTPKKWNDIVKANPQLVGRKTAIDGSPLIFPGDVLIITEDDFETNIKEPVQTIVLDEKAKKDLALYVDGKKFTGFSGYTINCAVDTFDAFSFSSFWDVTNKDLRNIFRPYTYKDCDVFFDGELIFKGTLLPATPSVSDNARTINVQGYPKCGVLGDSTLPDSLYPPEFNGLDLKQIAQNIAAPFGVKVTVKTNIGNVFEKVEISPEEKILDFLNKLAKERGAFITNEQDGSLLIWKPEEEPVSAIFKEGELPFVACRPTFNGQNMYSHVVGFSKTTGNEKAQKYVYENPYLKKNGILRVYTKTIDDVDGGSLKNATKALAGRMFASSAKYELEVTGHHDKNGKLYRKNMTVSVLAPDAEIYRETKFQVDEVELTRSDSDGEKTKFSLVLPGARNGELPEVFPWEE